MKNNISVLRKKKGLTIWELSEITGLSAGYICHLEKGSRSNLSSKTMEKIAKALEEEIFTVFEEERK